MTEIVLGVGASHTTLMNTQWDKVDHLERAHLFREGLNAAADALSAARPDAVVIIGSNHFRGFWLDLMPAFTIGVGEVISSGEHGTPLGPLPSDPGLGLAITEGLAARDIDVAFSAKMVVDHGISHAYQWLLRDSRTPIVPVVVNCFAPPLPALRRAEALGSALRAAITDTAGTRRVALVATGGLSHKLPFPDWRSPVGSDQTFLVDSWRDGRGKWQEYESRRRSIVVGARPQLNPEFDRWFLGLLETDGLSAFSSRMTDGELVSQAGNGGNEIRAWLALANAMGNQAGKTIVYSPMPEWLTGMAVAIIKLT